MNNRIITDDAGLRCPACSRPAFYLHFGDRFAHADGRPNRECWARITRGDYDMGVAVENERLLARARRRLDLAACRGQWELFDSTRVRAGRHVLEQARAEALGICAQCPALAACGEWLESLPRPPAAESVVAGRLIACKF